MVGWTWLQMNYVVLDFSFLWRLFKTTIDVWNSIYLKRILTDFVVRPVVFYCGNVFDSWPETPAFEFDCGARVTALSSASVKFTDGCIVSPLSPIIHPFAGRPYARPHFWMQPSWNIGHLLLMTQRSAVRKNFGRGNGGLPSTKF